MVKQKSGSTTAQFIKWTILNFRKMETVKKTLKISFSTQKGGVGKSTITTLLASLLHYRLGFNIVVLDCDFPQHSLSKMRKGI